MNTIALVNPILLKSTRAFISRFSFLTNFLMRNAVVELGKPTSLDIAEMFLGSCLLRAPTIRAEVSSISFMYDETLPSSSIELNFVKSNYSIALHQFKLFCSFLVGSAIINGYNCRLSIWPSVV